MRMLRFFVLSVVLASALGAALPSPDPESELSPDSVSKSEFSNALKKTEERANRYKLAVKECPKDMLKESDIAFILYTREKPNGTVIYKDQDNILASSLNVKKPLKVIIHSWLQDGNMTKMTVKDYLYSQNVDVMVVDWSAYSLTCSIESTSELVVPFVGETTAQMLRLIIGLGQNGRRIHLIGFSHGAHIAGIAGRNIAPHMAGRISALDPLRLDITDMPGDKKLLGGDASFIDVIVTSLPGLSFEYEIGDVTFFPNGGLTKYQTRCDDVNGEMEKMICSHKLAYKLFHESLVSPKKFPAFRCDTYSEFLAGACNDAPMAHMGEYVEKTASGRYFLEVNRDAPYDKGFDLPKSH